MTIVASLDYFSYTFEIGSPALPRGHLFGGMSSKSAGELRDTLFSNEQVLEDFKSLPPPRPYRYALQHVPSKTFIAWSPDLKRGLVQLPGQAVDYQEGRGALREIIDGRAGEATRVDIAVDMLTSCRPVEFAEDRSNDRFKTTAHWNSQEGETYYVGSLSSDRYARVYRYQQPHERADWLRAEMVFKRQEAKALAAELRTHTPGAVAGAAGAIYGWKHPAWQPAVLAEQHLQALPAVPKERHASKTLLWLEDTAIPAAIRLYEQGEIDDLYDWFTSQVRRRLNADNSVVH